MPHFYAFYTMFHCSYSNLVFLIKLLSELLEAVPTICKKSSKIGEEEKSWDSFA